MERERKTGDVAMVRWQTFPEVRGMYINGQWEDVDGAVFDGHEDDLRIRPLVVIDPEDVEAVQAFRMKVYEISGRLVNHKEMQDALREFANPTPDKPEEPTGLGAVVTDCDGDRWVRHADGLWSCLNGTPGNDIRDWHALQEYGPVVTEEVTQ